MSDFLREHLNVWWLRPESALWDAIASHYISDYMLAAPALDLGSGNGIFSFITAGGRFSPDYDWFVNTRLDKPDIYDASQHYQVAEHIVQPPVYRIKFAFDHKSNLLDQALSLGLYERGKVGDANQRLPFETESFQTVFSNVLYWLADLDAVLSEIYRIVRPGGHAILCLIDAQFREYCVSYQWQERNSEWLRRLNAGRSANIKWMLSWAELEQHVRRPGFHVVDHRYYISPAVLQLWDIGLRPLSRPLIKLSKCVGTEERREIKVEWIQTCYDLLAPLLQTELEPQAHGGMQLIYVERR